MVKGCADSRARPKHPNLKQMCLEGVQSAVLLAASERASGVF